jgi:hypothetical protein
MKDYYNFGNIRSVLMEGFSQEQLRTFCSVTPSFRAVYENLADANKEAFVREIIDHGRRQLKLEEVIEWVRQENPAQYIHYEPYVDLTMESGGQDEKAVLSILPDDHLGKGIRFGGSYRGIRLRIAATEWTPYGSDREIRSGWLFIPQWTANHALTFFKIHTYSVGEGYIHIADVTEPAHPVYLSTEAGDHLEMSFHLHILVKTISDSG